MSRKLNDILLIGTGFGVGFLVGSVSIIKNILDNNKEIKQITYKVDKGTVVVSFENEENLEENK